MIIRKNVILILAKGPTQRLEHTMAAEKICLINFDIFVWAHIIMEQIVICLLMVQKLSNLKQKILKLWQLHYV